jgi:hypothetical protein
VECATNAPEAEMSEDEPVIFNHKYHLKPDGCYYCEFCGAKLLRKPAEQDDEVDIENLSSQESSLNDLMCEQASEERENLHELRKRPGALAEQRRWASEKGWQQSGGERL